MNMNKELELALSTSYGQRYADGLKHGFKMILGESVFSLEAYEGPLNPEIEEWVRMCLGRLSKIRVSCDEQN